MTRDRPRRQPARPVRPVVAAAVGAAVIALVLAGCTGGDSPTTGSTSSRAASDAAVPVDGVPGPGPVAATTDTTAVRVAPDAEPTDVATGLEAPWSVVRLDTGSSFVSLRDSGRVVELTGDGSVRDVATIDGVVHEGESGLLGLAVLAGSPSYLYAYLTTADDNRIVRAPITGEPGSYGLGAVEDVFTGIPAARNHDGGRIAFGPDGMLWATTGDASDDTAAQDEISLGGKVLRLSPTGAVPSDNPMPGSPVWSLGHRNPQGIAWDAWGGGWVAEFGQDTWDELNSLAPGANYGWPEVEGRGASGASGSSGASGQFLDPVLQWRTDQASPSGLTAIGSTLFMAGLGGEVLFEIQVPETGDATSTERFSGDESLGRIRDVLPGPDGALWLLTNNTDGRGDARGGDDRIVSVPLEPLD
ncbi:PQQ-dependent sugar dehydrogenase [Frigoribacterium sp. ACAM 257]|uniref:PQQ-dependent sugar dehydrogenase n=1 Tax=Frigoribacterium sp. ACAM 257 TaxID=2508998 RepID=UPI0011BA0002|nr:PQQ-dependent sugar dehydrogenase [Frigoribacterium sp. ACAM 257]TWX38543.1 PQQ-dependent sugar dehydrogenase [Frigoribacterium sp. ACAM 257]